MVFVFAIIIKIDKIFVLIDEICFDFVPFLDIQSIVLLAFEEKGKYEIIVVELDFYFIGHVIFKQGVAALSNEIK